MNPSDVPPLRAQYVPANADEGEAATPDRNGLITLLHQIGSGAAADVLGWHGKHRSRGGMQKLAVASKQMPVSWPSFL